MHQFRRCLIIALLVSLLVTSIFVFSLITARITEVSAVEANGIGVYWDASCTREVSSIDWGNLTPGSSKSTVVNIRNEVQEPVYVFISMKNWNPSNAYTYITLSWNYNLQRLDPNEVIQVRLILSASRYAHGVSTFSFDTIVAGEILPGDVDNDGDVDVGDQRKVQLAMFTVLGDLRWNPDADIDGDEDVDISDQRICQIFLLIGSH